MSAAEFAEAVLAGDLDAARGLLADDVVFRSPAVFKPYEGIDATMVLLTAVARVFEDLHYTRSFAEEDGSGHVLLFEAMVLGKSVEGVDVLRFDDAGLICDFRVLIRPLSGLSAVVERMAEVTGQVMQELGDAQ